MRKIDIDAQKERGREIEEMGHGQRQPRRDSQRKIYEEGKKRSKVKPPQSLRDDPCGVPTNPYDGGCRGKNGV